jgi:hypothetical protein
VILLDKPPLCRAGVPHIRGSESRVGRHRCSPVPPWPANTPHVVAAGGTSLTVKGTSPNFSYGSEAAWSSGGSGCSSYQTAGTWQTALSSWSQTGCGSHRAIGDVSISATNLAVYDSYGFQGGTGWFQEAGTSVATPMIAAIFALAGGLPATKYGSEMPYEQGVYGTSLHDSTSGSNGSCSTIMCTAGAGYDGPTGLGWPSGGSNVASDSSPSGRSIAIRAHRHHNSTMREVLHGDEGAA